MDQEQQQQQQQRRQRRTTMPPRLIVSERRLSSTFSPEQASTPADNTDNADKNHDQSMWTELQELKSRLAKLEVQAPSETGNNKKSSICSPPITRPSSITSVVSSPHSPLVDSACSISNNNNKEVRSHSQLLLQDTVLHLETYLRSDDDPSNNDANTTFMNNLITLVAETITINQTLTSFGGQQQRHTPGTFTSSITNLQKSSERQVNLLADTLQSLMVHRQQHQTQQQQQQQQQQQYQQGPHQQPVSPPLSQSVMDSESVSPKPSKPHHTSSSNYSPPSVRQSRPPTQQYAYSYYHDEAIQNYNDDTSSQHSTFSRLQQRQQNRKSIISSSSSAISSNLPHYIKYSDLETSPTRQYYQQTHEQQSLASRHVSGILHQQHLPSYQQQQQQQQQQQSYYPSSVLEQQRQHSSTLQQPMASSRVNRLLSMYDSMLKPVASSAANTNSSPPMSPPSIQHHQYSQLHHHEDQQSYIDYRHH
ncbi:unnamed protein product [Absidia cylindrospora]